MATKRRGHGEGSIRQRPDGLWEARVSSDDGRRKSLYGKTRKEVQDKLRATLREIDDGLNVNAGRQTVAQYLEKWLSASVKPTAKVRTFEVYESIVRVRVVPRIGNKQLTKLTSLDLQALYTELADSGLSPRSVQHTHRVLHNAFEQAIKWSLMARNPCAGATAPRVERKEMEVLSPDEARKFLRLTVNHPAHALYVLALTTGMRAGELLGLKWSDVDLDAGRLTIQRALQQQNGGKGLVFVSPKTARSRRMVTLSQKAIATLRQHRDRQTFQRRTAGELWVDQDLVFPGPKGGPTDPSWSRQTFYKALKAAGVSHVKFHDLRHTAATLALAEGVHPKVVSDMLGHSSIGLTLDTYSHMLPAMNQQAAQAMDSILSDGETG